MLVQQVGNNLRIKEILIPQSKCGLYSNKGYLKKILRSEREIEKRKKRKEEEMAENSRRNKISLSNTISDVYVENNFVSWFNFAIFFRSLCAVIYLVLS